MHSAAETLPHSWPDVGRGERSSCRLTEEDGEDFFIFSKRGLKTFMYMLFFCFFFQAN